MLSLAVKCHFMIIIIQWFLYFRPVNSRAKPGDVIESEHESKTEEPLSLDIEICVTNLTTVGTQTDFRESETQTDPWDPPFVVKRVFKNPEVLHLKELTYGTYLQCFPFFLSFIFFTLNRNRGWNTWDAKA